MLKSDSQFYNNKKFRQFIKNYLSPWHNKIHTYKNASQILKLAHKYVLLTWKRYYPNIYEKSETYVMDQTIVWST
jgi:hypothetical protein